MAETLPETLRTAAARLAATSDTPRLDAEILMAHALGMSRGDMLLRQRDLTVPDAYAAMIDRRAGHEPVAYITGIREFWGLELRVSPDVLIPRPDSETLIEAAIGLYSQDADIRILDLGTGSGALLLAALSLFRRAKGTGMDASAAALRVAGDNIARLDMTDRAESILADWRKSDWIDRLHPPYDLVLANPPYVESDAMLSADVIRYEPAAALFAGSDGMDDYRILVPALCKLLKSGGYAVIEIGYQQGDAILTMAAENGWKASLLTDLSGRNRAMVAGPMP
jgi:release factor glutamine methyltransferase